jgi:hypothetical protein
MMEKLESGIALICLLLTSILWLAAILVLIIEEDRHD